MPKRSNAGSHNDNLEASRTRIIEGNTYRDLSTVWVTPIRDNTLHAKVVFESWLNLMLPMNQMVFRLPVMNMEVGDAYNKAVETILGNPQLSKFKYMLTLETDNMPPPDGLLKLYESIKGYDAVGGLYWTKGEQGQPMCYGDPAVMPRNFIPQPPPIDCVRQYNGLGMGFTLFKLAMFKKIPAPWFKTVQEHSPVEGSRQGTQDLYFFNNAAMYGYKFAVDGRVKVGHVDLRTGVVW